MLLWVHCCDTFLYTQIHTTTSIYMCYISHTNREHFILCEYHSTSFLIILLGVIGTSLKCIELGKSEMCCAILVLTICKHACLFTCLQVELLSHFGSEHFCPLSLIRYVQRPIPSVSINYWFIAFHITEQIH